MKFIYVFNETDRDTLLSRGYVLMKEPTQKKSVSKAKKNTKEKDVQEDVEKDVVKYWVFANKTVKDMVFDSLENYVFSDTLTF